MPVPDSSLEQDDLSEMKVNTEGVDENDVLTRDVLTRDVLTRDEIANLVHESGKPAETLMNLVALIAGRFQTDVCSAYLLEPDRAHLVLAATLGLRPQCIGTLRMGLHEGLAGLVAEQVRPVAVSQVKTHPRFKYFTEAGEDAYQSFLGVPLIDRGVLQGVLVVQTMDPRTFDPTEIATLADAAAQVAPVVSEARPRAALGAGAELVVELGPGFFRAVSGFEPGALAAPESESHIAAQ
jgi:signal transduction protein with GAF and PtsI domain